MTIDRNEISQNSLKFDNLKITFETKVIHFCLIKDTKHNFESGLKNESYNQKIFGCKIAWVLSPDRTIVRDKLIMSLTWTF
ncbi:hypothetical protein BpHYR1_008253 [Brachionus plicatilis]|uniref:Uncharacterized protein n=1 Tax=Brachionus plicatilis TaxID=10195 RepID=A0A3M7QMZ9_BRAPC|nr:hypothetical protein BpHYR1_008253 [Brachionus plicatilis]